MHFHVRNFIGLLKNCGQHVFGPRKSTMFRRSMSNIPLVVILGETGVGKTKLAIELCQRFNGEVISADSMQIYEGLDIITNKVTPEEACGIPHHMISILAPGSSNFNVQVFRNQALKLMEEMWTKRGKVPVIVGGTNYYIEALLWDRLIPGGHEKEEDEEPEKAFVRNIPFDVNSMTDEQLHEELRKIDPVMANRKHPKKRRAVIRSLQVFFETGRAHSQWLIDQHGANGGNVLGGPLRFPRLCLLWLTCDDRAILNDRLSRRVDDMVARGLQEEITAFYDRYFSDYAQKYPDDVTTKGVFQSIGLKEFEKYLDLPPDRRSTAEGSRAFEEGVQELKAITNRYAKKQRQWITNRICRLAARDSIPIYCLDATDVGKWRENVSDLTEKIVEAFLDGRIPEVEVKMASGSLENYANEFSVENRFCDVCQRLVAGLQWDDHVKSKWHRIRNLNKARVPKSREEWERMKLERERELKRVKDDGKEESERLQSENRKELDGTIDLSDFDHSVSSDTSDGQVRERAP